MANYKNVNIEKISDTKYKLADSVNAGYLNRGSYLYVSFTSIIELIDTRWTVTSIKNDDDEHIEYIKYSTKEIEEKFKSFHVDDILRSRRACTRHLFALYVKLGIKKVKEIEYQEYIIRDQYNFNDLKVVKGKLTAKRFTFERGDFFNNPIATLSSEEKLFLYDEYKEKYKDFLQYQKETYKKLFDN